MRLSILTTSQGVLCAVAALVALAGLWFLLALLEKRRTGKLATFADPELLDRLVAGHTAWLRRPLNGAVMLGALFLLFSLAQPRWGESTPGTRRGSREILVLLDTSESMNAVNPPPSRLARAQAKVSALLEACPGDRFGLVAFSGAAVLECPFTRDHAYFKTVLQSITTDTLTEEGTSIVAALKESARIFLDEQGAGTGAGRQDRIVLLVSDGETDQSDAEVLAKELATSCRIAVLGIGDPDGAEVRLPQWMDRSRFGSGGVKAHWSVLNEDALSALALAGDGVYVRSTLGGEDLEVIQREMASLEGIVGPDGAPLREVNRYRWPLGIAIIFFSFEGLWLVLMPRCARYFSRRKATEEGAHALV